MDDIGDDELSPGKPNTATDGGILPPLGLIRSLKNNEYETSFMKLHAADGTQGPDFLDNGFPDIASSLHGDPNGSRELSEI